MMILERIKNEPAVIAGVVQAVLGLLLAFGVDLTTEQNVAIMAVTAALLALLVRSQVTPTRRIPSESGQTDALGVALIALVIVVILVLLGVIR